jgi:hypothetical protein
VVRVRVSERLHITPAEVDSIAYLDLCDLLEVWRADDAEATARRQQQGA